MCLCAAAVLQVELGLGVAGEESVETLLKFLLLFGMGGFPGQVAAFAGVFSQMV